MCELVQAGLKDCNVTYSTSPMQAIDLVRQGTFDVVLTDLRMKGMTGNELCRALRDMRPDVPVLLMTAFGSVESAAEALRAGAYDYVTKPIEMGALRLAVHSAVKSKRLREEVVRVRGVSSSTSEGTILGSSAGMKRVRELVERVAASDASVLITGESGTGKELVARAIHDASSRKAKPFVAINCAAMPESLLESELFGHAKGAFTDAKAAHAGLFVDAEGGTLLLDEIGDMPVGLQPKLLRALQERRVRPVGSTAEVPFDVRIIAATHRDLERASASGAFREDLYYRLNVVEIGVPPLRTRGDDVLLLAQHFLEKFAATSNQPVRGMAPAVAERLRAYPWPGNVRELANAMERAVALTHYRDIVVDDLPERVRQHVAPRFAIQTQDAREILPLEEIERRYILATFEALGKNRSLTAQMLDIDRKTLYRKLERWGAGNS